MGEKRELHIGLTNSIKIILLSFVGSFLYHHFEINFFAKAKADNASEINASAINLVDSLGKPRVQIGFAKEGPPGIWVLDEKGIARIAMGLYLDGTSHIGLQDKNGMMIELMRSLGANESPLLIFKSKGQDQMILGLSTLGDQSFLTTFEKDRKRKSHIGTYLGP